MAAARASPYIEELKERGIEVLLLGERIDEWVMGQLDAFEGKHFKDAARGDLELGALAGEADRKRQEEALKESKPLLKRVKDALGRSRHARCASARGCSESPACLVLGEHELGASMRRILAAAGQKPPESKPALELNVDASAGAISRWRGGCQTASRRSRSCFTTRRRWPRAASWRIRPSTCSASTACSMRLAGVPAVDGLMRWRHGAARRARASLPGPAGASKH